jgi:hypothetical protein
MDKAQPEPLLLLYRDGDSFFLALPDFVDLQESDTIWLSELDMRCLIAEHAAGKEVEYRFFDAIGSKRREYF